MSDIRTPTFTGTLPVSAHVLTRVGDPGQEIGGLKGSGGRRRLGGGPRVSSRSGGRRRPGGRPRASSRSGRTAPGRVRPERRQLATHEPSPTTATATPATREPSPGPVWGDIRARPPPPTGPGLFRLLPEGRRRPAQPSAARPAPYRTKTERFRTRTEPLPTRPELFRACRAVSSTLGCGPRESRWRLRRRHPGSDRLSRPKPRRRRRTGRSTHSFRARLPGVGTNRSRTATKPGKPSIADRRRSM